MRMAYFGAALVTGLGFAIAIGPVHNMSGLKQFSLGSQGFEGKAPVVPHAELTKAEALPPPHLPLDTLTREDGRRLSCDEIRAMDEVELITDGSYCD